ncbi:hypothetical protein KY290_005060 [Solanum tuberosum]|uniref:Uncharacterized protein n=1 Tax=Solanum tuberosum TaxID=4113 RepID=A0ABQ7WEV0_SOLTU|nr:hypothetical protein KY290_005060 [Solanum tuberosum]
MDHTANEAQGGEQPSGGNKNVENNIEADGNRQTVVNTNKGNITMDPIIPPPIKVSSNFDIYRPNHPKPNQFSPKKNQNRPPFNNSGNKNINSQTPEPSPPTVVQSLATRLRANQAKSTTHVIITPLLLPLDKDVPLLLSMKKIL